MPACIKAKRTPWEKTRPPRLSRLSRIRAGWTINLSITFTIRESAKSSTIATSGPIVRSTAEWEISLSCQTAIFSILGITPDLTMRAKPVKFSVRMGLRLWGIAEEPFCPGSKYSSTSLTSVRWRWRISVANLSSDPEITPKVAKNIAWRSRGMIWEDIGSMDRPNLLAT